MKKSKSLNEVDTIMDAFYQLTGKNYNYEKSIISINYVDIICSLY